VRIQLQNVYDYSVAKYLRSEYIWSVANILVLSVLVPTSSFPGRKFLRSNNDTFSRADMTTFDDLPRDIQLLIFREALFDDYDACVRGPHGSWPKSLWIPELPEPVEPLTWEAPGGCDQVPFDPVPPGVTEGLHAVKAAIVISTVSKSFMSLARDASMWKAVLDAAEWFCETEEEHWDTEEPDPPLGTYWFESTSFKVKMTDFELNLTDEDVCGLTEKYSQPRLDEKWFTLSTFNRCRKMLMFIEMIYEDFYEQCHDYNACVTFAACVLTHIATYILDPEEDFMRYEMVRRTDKEPGEVTLFNNDSDDASEGFEVFEGFTPPAVGRMLWNTFADGGMNQGSVGLREFWEILSGGPMNIGVGNSSTDDCLHYVVLNELLIQRYLEDDPNGRGG